ncbi:MAG TPA: chemotactic signal-response protein chel [Alphaproteobacteria bacterium]|nr:chemotactic signal-response protein chel [Alphaproteobacteria bacterium]
MSMDAMNLQVKNAFDNAKVIPRINPKAGNGKIRKMAETYEAFFLSRVLQPIFSGIKAAEPFGGGVGEDMWRSLQVDEYGKAIAANGGIGLADGIMREILKLQEGTKSWLPATRSTT